jgi:adenylate kinase
MTIQDADRAAWFKGASVECSTDPTPPQRPFRLVLLGAPGVGKGTQAELISQRLKPCHLSTGDVFRAAKSLPASERTPAEALARMQRGELVPDDTVINIVRERSRCMTCPSGFLLDGFPRTVRQAEALAALLTQLGVKLDAVLSYDMPLEQVIARLSGRRTCAGCKAVFHVTGRPPKVPDVCDNCGGKLVLRDDDRPESIRVRMQAYQASTAPLADYYQKAGLLVSLSAAGTPEEIYQRTAAALSSLHR